MTILALGGLLAIILEKPATPSHSRSGLLTASGSIGLLFPPSLPVIIYGVTSQTSIKDMFVGGLLPGAFLVISVMAIGIIYSWKRGMPRHALKIREAVAVLRESFWELLLPLLIFCLYFGGIVSLRRALRPPCSMSGSSRHSSRRT